MIFGGWDCSMRSPAGLARAVFGELKDDAIERGALPGCSPAGLYLLAPGSLSCSWTVPFSTPAVAAGLSEVPSS
jgi:hypothetical protein